MKMTLLQMVQSVMSDMDSDSVTSINDTVESLQVVSTIKDVFDQMISNQMIPEEMALNIMSTVALGTYTGALNYLQTPTGVDRVDWLQYNRKKSSDTFDQFEEITYIEPREFMKLMSKNMSDQGNVAQVTDPVSNVTYYVVNDQAPQFYTSFDDNFIAFDMFDQGIDTVQVTGPKSLIYAKNTPVWTASDGFIPAIDANLFPYLLAESKSTCFVNLKQQANPKIEKQSVEQRVRLQNHRYRDAAAEKARTGSTGPDYGRRRH